MVAGVGRAELVLAPAAVAGVAYGLVIWALLAVVVMPIWLSTIGFGMAPDVPNVAVESLVGHAVYGLVLGLTYAVLTR